MMEVRQGRWFVDANDEEAIAHGPTRSELGGSILSSCTMMCSTTAEQPQIFSRPLSTMTAHSAIEKVQMMDRIVVVRTRDRGFRPNMDATDI